MQFKEYTWGPPLWKSTLTDEIIEGLLSRGSNIRGNEIHNAEINLGASTHDEWNYPRKDINWFQSKIEPYINSFMKSWAAHIDKEEINLKWTYDSLWINYIKTNDFNPLHDHVGNISSVMYLNDVDELQTEKERLGYVHNGPIPGSIVFSHNDEMKFFFPKKGDIYLFPANLLHMVVPFKTPDVTRISVSGNVFFEDNPLLNYHI